MFHTLYFGFQTIFVQHCLFIQWRLPKLNREVKIIQFLHPQSLTRVQLCNPTDHSPPGSSVHSRIFPERLLEWVAISSSRGSSWLRDWTRVSCIAGGFFTTEPTGKLGNNPELFFWIWVTFLLLEMHKPWTKTGCHQNYLYTVIHFDFHWKTFF